MLIVNVKEGDYVMIGDNIKVYLIDKGLAKPAIGIDAPKDVPILRQEIYERGNIKN